MPVVNNSVMKKCEQLEKENKFHTHINPIIEDSYYKVDENFKYVDNSFKTKSKRFFQRTFLVNPQVFMKNQFDLKTKVYGKKNLKGIKSAIITCNHFFIFDCLAIKRALKGHKHIFTVAEFNNQKGKLGDLMRASGILPFSSNFQAMKNMSKAIGYYLKNNHYVVFYPEEAMWEMYAKPRPFQNGAFHYAVKNNVPIIPFFITFRDSGKTDKNNNKIYYFNVNISKPIYQDTTLTNKENVEYLKNKNYEICKNIYEKFYNKELKYAKMGE